MLCVLRGMIPRNVLDFQVRFRRVLLLRVEYVCHVVAKLKQVLSTTAYKSKGASITGSSADAQTSKSWYHDAYHFLFLVPANAKVLI